VLADLGAEVIKVEPVPDGDNTRRLTGSGAGFFPTYNRNKKSLAVDLKSTAGREIVLRLIGTADAVTENFRSGAMAKLGLDYASLSKLNPRLIYCSHKGFLAGPYETRTALDEVVQMMGGLAYMTGPPGRPLRAGASVNDVMGGMFGAIGIMAALLQRQHTGRGQEIKSGLFENNAFLVGQHMAQFRRHRQTGRPPCPTGCRPGRSTTCSTRRTASRSSSAWSRTRNGNCSATAFGRADLLADPSLAANAQRVHCARPRHPDRRRSVRPIDQKAELMAKCEAVGLPYAPITKPEDLFDDPHLNASGGLVETRLPGGVETKLPNPAAGDGWASLGRAASGAGGRRAEPRDPRRSRLCRRGHRQAAGEWYDYPGAIKKRPASLPALYVSQGGLRYIIFL